MASKSYGFSLPKIGPQDMQFLPKPPESQLDVNVCHQSFVKQTEAAL